MPNALTWRARQDKFTGKYEHRVFPVGLHQDEPGSAAEAPGNTSGTQIPQAQLTAASAAFISDPADQKIQTDALQQQIRDLQRAAAMDMAPVNF